MAAANSNASRGRWWRPARASSRPTNRPAPSRSASTRSRSNRPRRAAAPTASCCSRRPAPQSYISGVILYDETLRQKTRGRRCRSRSYLAHAGHHSRHQGRHGRQAAGRLPGRDDHRGPRRPARAARGVPQARRALREVARGDRHRRRASRRRSAIDANAHALARYAALCQEAGIVPIVEPEVLMDGDHTIERCEEVTDATLRAVFDALFAHRVHLEGMVLKPNMVISGKKCARAGVAAAGRRGDRALPASATCRPRCRASPSCPAARAKPRRRST